MALALVLTIFGYGQGLVMAPLSSAVRSAVKPVSAAAASGIYGTAAQIANATGAAAIGAVFFAIESVEPAGAACRIGAVCAVDYRLRRIPDMDASGHAMTN
jgi:predicted MFS family arabinose efflux permease